MLLTGAVGCGSLFTVFIRGIAPFGIMPGIQVRIMNLAYEVPLLASTSSHSALNLGNAGGAFIGGVVINQMGLAAIPWVASLITVGGLPASHAGQLRNRPKNCSF